MTTQVAPHASDGIFTEYWRLEKELSRAEFPRLVEEEVTDDGETYKALRCPRCGGLVDSENLVAVDRPTRWSYIDEPDDDSFDHQRLTFNCGDTEYEDTTLYYLHNEDHAVNLPHDWVESWY